MKRILWFFCFLILLVILVVAEVVQAFVPEVFGESLKNYLNGLSPIYIVALLLFFVVIIIVAKTSVVLSFFKKIGNIGHNFDQGNFNIPWSLEAKQRLQNAKDALAKANHQTALRLLYEFDSPSLKDTLSLLSAQLANHQLENIAGVLATDEKNVAFNKLTNGILSVIKSVESNFLEKEAQNKKIRDSIRGRYRERLNQKMASRQAVKLQKWVSKEGTSELIASTFKTYPEKEIPEEIGKLFQDAYGRLLIIGRPGKGKTTLLLELADRLFDLEADALPLLINLASWKSGFIKLETWLEEVLASELSTNKSGVKAVLQQSNLILLLDGLDELKEESDMASCLAAIAEYSATAGRRFVITCRKKEYKAVQEDAKVNMQIEVGSLDTVELMAELNNVGYGQPGAKVLAQAIRNDALLQMVVTTPFYFNTLQVLYAGKIPIFTTTDLKKRKHEIEQKFIEYALNNTRSNTWRANEAEYGLSFLAKRMTDRSKVVFELVDLQYDWLERWSKWEAFNIRLLNWLIESVYILIVAVCLYAFASKLSGKFLFFWALIHLLIYINRSQTPKIITRDIIKFSIKSYGISLKNNFWGAIIWWLFIGLIIKIIVGESGAILAGMTIGVVAVFMSAWNDLLDNSSDFIQIKSAYQRFYSSMKVLNFSILQHWHLRYLLHKKRLVPCHFVDFLIDMKACHILESDGATWRFRHRILQDYFAERWVEPVLEEGKKLVQKP